MQNKLAAAQAPAHQVPQGEVTFRGRGLASVTGHTLTLQVCPKCSQWNERAAELKGYCFWCAYVPSLADARPAA